MQFHLVRDMLRGFAAGLAGTTTMTATMFVLQKSGLLGRMPPRLLVERTLMRVGLHRGRTSRRTRHVLTTLGHVGCGGPRGAAFEVARRAIAARRGRDGSLPALGLAGVAFGTAVWVVSYAGVIPAVGLMARPSKDRLGRPTAMILAHWIYGATVALTAGTQLASRADEVTP